MEGASEEWSQMPLMGSTMMVGVPAMSRVAGSGEKEGRGLSMSAWMVPSCQPPVGSSQQTTTVSEAFDRDAVIGRVSRAWTVDDLPGGAVTQRDEGYGYDGVASRGAARGRR